MSMSTSDKGFQEKNLKTDQLLGNNVSWFVGYDWSAILQTDKQEE